MRKNIFYSLMLGVMTLASCNKQIDVPTFKAQDGEIFFGNKGLTIETKAVTESTISVLESNGFNAAIALEADGSVMFNKAVAYNGGVYTVPGETYYYPVDGSVSAYAVYPKTETIVFDEGAASIAYTQNASEDLIVAKVNGISKQSEAIDLHFAHALSQVSFKVKGADANADYVLKLIEVTAPNGGTYQYADGTWADLGDATAYTVYSNAGAAAPTNSFQAFGESMTFVPGEVSLHAVWDCKNKVDGTIVGQYDQTKTIALDAGQSTVLKLTLPNDDAMEIKFSASIQDWNVTELEETMGGESFKNPKNNEIWCLGTSEPVFCSEGGIQIELSNNVLENTVYHYLKLDSNGYLIGCYADTVIDKYQEFNISDIADFNGTMEYYFGAHLIRILFADQKTTLIFDGPVTTYNEKLFQNYSSVNGFVYDFPTHIVFPSTVGYLGDQIFGDGVNSSFAFTSSVPCETSETTFDDFCCPAIYVPDSALAIYQEAWCDWLPFRPLSEM